MPDGWRAGAPYDAILVDGAAEVVPNGLLRQLKDGGRLVCVAGRGPASKAMLLRLDRPGRRAHVPIFDAAAPQLPHSPSHRPSYSDTGQALYPQPECGAENANSRFLPSFFPFAIPQGFQGAGSRLWLTMLDAGGRGIAADRAWLCVRYCACRRGGVGL